MGRRQAHLLAPVAALLALGGCSGASEKSSDAKISDAAQVQDGRVKGDPFCEVDEILNDAGEIEEASGKKGASIITSKVGNVGVTVVPPFPDDCEATVRKGLDKLDPKPKEKE